MYTHTYSNPQRLECPIPPWGRCDSPASPCPVTVASSVSVLKLKSCQYVSIARTKSETSAPS